MNTTTLGYTSTTSAPEPVILPGALELNPTSAADRDLWLRYGATPDVETRQLLLKRYAYLVRYVIGRMKVRLVPTLDHDDLHSVGCIGLIKALDRFSLDHGVKFETYAYRWIQGHVLDYVRQLDVLTRTSRERVTQFRKVYRDLREKLSREPLDEEITDAMNVTLAELNSLYFEIGSTEAISLQGYSRHSGAEEGDSDSSEEEWHSAGEPGALDTLERGELMGRLQSAIDRLPERERQVISLYYHEELTLKEIGEVLGVSESRVCQLHSKAVADLQLSLSRE